MPETFPKPWYIATLTATCCVRARLRTPIRSLQITSCGSYKMRIRCIWYLGLGRREFSRIGWTWWNIHLKVNPTQVYLSSETRFYTTFVCTVIRLRLVRKISVWNWPHTNFVWKFSLCENHDVAPPQTELPKSATRVHFAPHRLSYQNRPPGALSSTTYSFFTQMWPTWHQNCDPPDKFSKTVTHLNLTLKLWPNWHIFTKYDPPDTKSVTPPPTPSIYI